MNRRTALIGAALVIVAVISLIVLSGGESDNDEPIVDKAPSGKPDGGNPGKANKEAPAGKTTPADPQAPIIVIDESGEPVGGVAELSFDKGDRIRFEVRSAVADEIHVHGYDLMQDVEAGGTVGFDFPADLEGIYEAELEGRGVQIAELRVNP